MAIGIGGRSNTGRGTAPNAPRHRNRAPNRARTTFGCGHRGLGTFCHRCKQGEILLKLAESLKPDANQKVMLAEAKRLLGPATVKAKKT